MRLLSLRPLLIVACLLALPMRAPAPLVYRAGEGWVYGPANQLTEPEKAAGWKLLFDGGTTQGWRTFKKQSFPDQGWKAENGWLHCLGKGGGNKGGGDIVSDSDFGDFDLQWDWKQAPKGNSGLKYFILESRKEALGHEYQMIDDEHAADGIKNGRTHITAAFYDVLAPGQTSFKAPGEVNHSRILVKGNHVEHWLNGEKVLAYECGSDAEKAAVAESKFKNVAGFGDKVRGHLLLQDHNSEVWFQNVKIKEP
jgi:3-keto-disaccharide hydrolase